MEQPPKLKWTFESDPSLTLNQLLQLLEIYQKKLRTILQSKPEDQAVVNILTLTDNTLFYLQSFKNGLTAMSKLTDAMDKHPVQVMEEPWFNQ